MPDSISIFPPGIPKYQAVASHYEEAIARGKYQVGDRLPPERELAAAWDITPMTVRQALDVLKTKQLIVRRQGQGTFVTAPPPPPPPQTTGCIYLLGLNPTDSSLFRQVNWQPRLRRYQGIVEAAFRHGVTVKSNIEPNLDTPPAELVELLKSAGGIILQEELLPEGVLAGLAEAKVPMVAINCYPQVDYCSRILIDSRRGAFAAVRHLAELGHSRIAIIAGDPESYSHGLRLSGYRDAHELLNLPLRDEYTIIEACGLEEPTIAACRRLLTLPQPPTAIFTASDRRAIGIVEAADELGISIPHDLSLIGFDDLAEAATTSPALTTLHNPIYESGEQAVDLLVKLMNGDAQMGTVNLLPTQLVDRASTAPLTR